MVPCPEGFRALNALPRGPFHLLQRIRRCAANSFPAHQSRHTHGLTRFTPRPACQPEQPPGCPERRTHKSSRLTGSLHPRVTPRWFHDPRSAVSPGVPRRVRPAIRRPGCRMSVPARRPSLSSGGPWLPDISEELHASLIQALPFVIRLVRKPTKHQPTRPLTPPPSCQKACTRRHAGFAIPATWSLKTCVQNHPASGWIVSPPPRRPEALRKPLPNPPAEPARRPLPPAWPPGPRICIRRSASKNILAI